MKIINNPTWFNQNTGLLLLRIGVGVVFLVHGYGKLGNMEGTIGFFAMLGLPALIAWAVALIETIGGIALIAGIYTRVSALALAIIMIGAVSTAKRGKPFGSFELDFVLFMANFALAAIGPGKYAFKKKTQVASSQI